MCVVNVYGSARASMRVFTKCSHIVYNRHTQKHYTPYEDADFFARCAAARTPVPHVRSRLPFASLYDLRLDFFLSARPTCDGDNARAGRPVLGSPPRRAPHPLHSRTRAGGREQQRRAAQRRAHPREPVLGLKLLRVLDRVVDEREAGRLGATCACVRAARINNPRRLLTSARYARSSSAAPHQTPSCSQTRTRPQGSPCATVPASR